VKVAANRCRQTARFPAGGEALGQSLFTGAYQAGEGHAFLTTQPAGEGRFLRHRGFAEIPE
jgi:hypothetical protein